MTVFGITILITLVIVAISLFLIFKYKIKIEPKKRMMLVLLYWLTGLLVYISLYTMNDSNIHYFSEFSEPINIEITNKFQEKNINSFTAILTYDDNTQIQLFYNFEFEKFKENKSILTLTDINGKQLYHTYDITIIRNLPTEIKNKIKEKTKFIIE